MTGSRRLTRSWIGSISFLLLAGAASAQEAVEVRADVLNVRSAAWGTVLGQVSRGDRFVVSGRSGDWLEVYWGGRRAWLSAAYVRAVAAPRLEIAAGALNVRSSASTAYEPFGVVYAGQRYVKMDTRGGWHLVQYDRREGWVSASYTRDLGGNSGGTSASQPASAAAGNGRGIWHAPMNVSQSDLEVLARICKGEASVAPYEGQVAVCAVVLNRVRSGRFPNSIPGVAHQPWQFSCYNADVRGRLYWGTIPNSCWQAAREALAGRDPTFGATHYFNPFLVRPSWARNLTFTIRIGTTSRDAHDFYR